MKIPFVNLTAQRTAYREELQAAAERVYASGCFIGGIEVERLEEELSAYVGVPYTVSCASGTDALTLALMALELRPGDEVIVPDFSFIAPAECVRFLGGTPRFADISPGSFLIDPLSVKELINPKTKGIIAVNLFGECAPYEELRRIASQNQLWLLEDAAQSFGAAQNGKRSGSLADIAITSFYPTKPLGCYGDGGALFTRNQEIAARVRKLANHGSTSRYLHECTGINSRLDSLQAAVLRVKLSHLNQELKLRQSNAEKYDSFFSNFQEIQIPVPAAGNQSSFAQYTLRSSARERWLSHLKRAEIPCCIHYPSPLHRQPCFADLKPETQNTPHTKKACEEVFSLPICAFTDTDLIIQFVNASL
ncbi:MAG: DegT/DnrJ/EryC1/StrS family aminotransferase [Fibrobacter sp.]|jgi:UDP-2-acetamido-2-deoxy-ribo-hexuluronate aminotransferase|nr:DegT/DnrJ/EryC1/StrS family aminotransferase [Fibrobacter sp.]